MPGKETNEPAFGVAARWIQPALEDQATAAGYSVVDTVTVISTHIGEMIRRHAHELLGRAETKRLLDAVNETHPKLVEELVPKMMSLGEVQKVLQAIAAGAGLDSRSGQHPRSPGGRGCGQQESAISSRDRPAGVGQTAFCNRCLMPTARCGSCCLIPGSRRS